MKKNYTALTIGPIHKTLQSVKSTKAIWSASYMFSFLMIEMIKKIKAQNAELEFIVPHTGKVNINGKTQNPLVEKYETGLFPDRIILKGKIELQGIIDNVVNDFVAKAANDMKRHNKQSVIEYINSYLNIYHLNIELGDEKNVILEINNLLDSMELQQRVIEDAKNDFLVEFFERISPYNFLIKSEFAERPFSSTIEIATAEFNKNEEYQKAQVILKDKDDEESQTKFMREIKAIVKDQFRNYQKYIAVVQADGDNIGAFIKSLYTLPNKEELIKRFSENLLSFAIEAVGLIKTYKGTPIYAGGDDLLYFMPVASTVSDGNHVIVSKTLFSLISEIDNLFDVYFTNYNKDGVDFESIIKNAGKKPSMSYGVSISYYKYPLNQALEQGAKQLFGRAKAGNKDAVSFTILKHSGHYFGTTFHKDSAAYATFTDLVTTKFEKEEFIKSIIRKLDPQKAVLLAIGEELNDEKRIEMIKNFFRNNFNESIHKDKNDLEKLVPFLEITKQLVKDVYSEQIIKGSKEEKEKLNDENVMKIYSALRFIEFIHNKEERDD
ncbi:MAG: type III-B CRISPR-associated protein Cas10/Cmr2 [Ignavibacteriales bacterium]|nr:type III-B CRISPR-associated protein Cas10/Cmr2 [Ignavibacteriales bacterium]